jgi:F-type H+-transporting ATPase subunit gamma
MKTLSSVSLGGYDRSARALDGYARNVESALRVVLRGRSVPGAGVETRRTVALVIGSDQGLVGRFNRSLVEHFEKYAEGRDATLLAAGRALVARVATKREIDSVFAMPGSAKGVARCVKKIILRLDSVVSPDAELVVFHNKRRGGAFECFTTRLLPIDARILARIKSSAHKGRNAPLFTSDFEPLFRHFLSELLFVGLYRAVSESLAAEHFTRMVTMQNAKKNIDERLGEMQVEYQTRRQDDITSELIDVISGFGAAA